MEARWGGKVEVTKKTNNADQVVILILFIPTVIQHLINIKKQRKPEQIRDKKNKRIINMIMMPFTLEN